MEAHLFGLNQRAASPSAAKPRRTTLDAAALSRSYMPPPREVSRATPLHLELNHLSFHVLHGFVGNQMRGLPQQGGAPQVGSLPPTRPKTASSPVVGKLDYARFAKPCSVEELGALQRELADWRAQQRRGRKRIDAFTSFAEDHPQLQSPLKEESSSRATCPLLLQEGGCKQDGCKYVKAW